MKTKLSICAVLTLFGASAALAEYSRDQLAAFSAAEKNWTSTSATVAGFDGSVGVDLTDTGVVRLSELPTSFRAQAEIDMPSLKRMNANVFASWCNSNLATFSSLKSQGYGYSLRMPVYPFSTTSQISVGSSAIPGFENPPSIYSFMPKLTLSADSISASETEINTADFERMVATQLRAKKAQIASTGEIVLDLTGWDDVACDLASGTANLSVGVSMGFEAPRVQRQTVISAQDMQALFTGTKSLFRPQSGVLENNIVAAVSLGASIVTQLKKAPSDFRAGDLFALYGQLVDYRSGSLLALEGKNFNVIAANLDHLSRGNNIATPSILTKVSVPNR